MFDYIYIFDYKLKYSHNGNRRLRNQETSISFFALHTMSVDSSPIQGKVWLKVFSRLYSTLICVTFPNCTTECRIPKLRTKMF